MKNPGLTHEKDLLASINRPRYTYGGFQRAIGFLSGRNFQSMEDLTEIMKLKGQNGGLKSIFAGKGFKVTNRNPGMIFNEIKNLNGSTLLITNSSGTIAIAAANVARVQTAYNVGADVASMMTNVETPVYLDLRSSYSYLSTAPFEVMPFVMMMENGESYTNSDVNSNDVNAAVETGFAAEDHIVQLGPLIMSRPINDSGTKYIAEMNIDLTALANLYAEHLSRKTLEEENPLVLSFGVYVKGIASQTVAYTVTQSFAYFKQRKEMFS